MKALIINFIKIWVKRLFQFNITHKHEQINTYTLLFLTSGDEGQFDFSLKVLFAALFLKYDLLVYFLHCHLSVFVYISCLQNTLCTTPWPS